LTSRARARQAVEIGEQGLSLSGPLRRLILGRQFLPGPFQRAVDGLGHANPHSLRDGARLDDIAARLHLLQHRAQGKDRGGALAGIAALIIALPVMTEQLRGVIEAALEQSAALVAPEAQ